MNKIVDCNQRIALSSQAMNRRRISRRILRQFLAALSIPKLIDNSSYKQSGARLM